MAETSTKKHTADFHVTGFTLRKSLVVFARLSGPAGVLGDAEGEDLAAHTTRLAAVAEWNEFALAVAGCVKQSWCDSLCHVNDGIKYEPVMFANIMDRNAAVVCRPLHK